MTDTLPSTRSEAILQGTKFYLTGKPCVRGHVSRRYTSIGKCFECGRVESTARYHAVCKHNPTYVGRNRSRARQQHADVGTKWYHEHKAHAFGLNKACRESNRESFSEYTTQWRRNNLDKLTKNAAAYRASKIKATPRWADATKIQRMYTEANLLTQSTGWQYTVDHVIPLNGDLVCGLHVETNLQLLTQVANSSKGNKYE